MFELKPIVFGYYSKVIMKRVWVMYVLFFILQILMRGLE